MYVNCLTIDLMIAIKNINIKMLIKNCLFQILINFFQISIIRLGIVSTLIIDSLKLYLYFHLFIFLIYENENIY